MTSLLTKRFFVGLLSACFVTAAGCTTTRPVQVTSAEQLLADPNNPGLLWWEREGFDWTHYRGVILDPVDVRLRPEVSGHQIPADDATRLAETFHSAVVTELSGHYRVTDTPAVDVLRIRSAITDLEPGNTAVNVLTSLAIFIPLDIGGASIEVDFIDSMTGERVAAAVERKRGSLRPSLEGLTRYGHAQQAFREWARDLRVALETNP